MLVLFSDHTWYYVETRNNALEMARNHIWRPHFQANRVVIIINNWQNVEVLSKEEIDGTS